MNKSHLTWWIQFQCQKLKKYEATYLFFYYYYLQFWYAMHQISYL